MKRTEYQVEAVRSGGWWALSFPKVAGVFSQARRLADAEGMARDALSLAHGRAPDSFDVRVVPALDETTRQAVDRAVAARALAERARRDSTESTRLAARRMIEVGLPLRDVAHTLGVSFQYAARLAKQGEPEPRELG